MLCRCVCAVTSLLPISLISRISLVMCATIAAQAPAKAEAGAAEAANGANARQAIERVLDANVPPGRAGQDAAHARARTRRPRRRIARSIRDAAAKSMDSGITEIRTAAVEALGATGPEAVPALTRAMADYHYEVRAAAATALGTHRPARAARRGGARRRARSVSRRGRRSRRGARRDRIGSASDRRSARQSGGRHRTARGPCSSR